jgi:elongator complex protein 3
MVMANTPLEKLLKQGKYLSYSDEQLIELICDVKKHVPYWIRIMRTIRDIPANNIISGSKTSNLRQIVLAKASCNCIRCREVKNIRIAENRELFIDEYEASEGREFFLSFESNDRKHLYSLLRLRFPSYHLSACSNSKLPEISGCALIREVHTYGQQAEIGEKSETQHRGLGRKLIEEAEKIAKENGYIKIAVISGVGVRNYYRKFGYELDGEYMIKNLA